MAEFNGAVERTLKFEGILSNDKYDSGGLTKYGISKRAYPKLDIAKLTVEDAKNIYERDYWKACKCDEISSQAIAEQLFDIAVNCGNYGAVKLIQRAVNAINMQKGIKVDGKIGRETLGAIAKCDEKTLNNQLVDLRVAFYKEIVNRNATQEKFLKGWLIRAEKFRLK